MKYKFDNYKIGEIYDVSSGLSKDRSFFGKGNPFLSFKIVFNNYFVPNELLDLVETTSVEVNKYSIKKGDVFLTRTSETQNELGMSCVALKDYPKATFNGFTKRLRLKHEWVEKVDDIFVGYYFRSDLFRKNVTAMSSLTTRASLNNEMINRLPIYLPNIVIQKKIGVVLASIDEKIKLNNKINDNLHSQLDSLFYEFWNKKKLIKNIEWNKKRLGDLVDIKRGGSPRPIADYISDTGYRWLKISDVTSVDSPYIWSIKEHIKEEGLKKTVLLKAGNLVLSNSATPGIPKIIGLDTCIHDGWLYFTNSKLSNYFLYLLFRNIRTKLISFSNGSIFNNLKTDIVKDYEVDYPGFDVLNQFDSLVYPFFEKLKVISIENTKLIKLRDALLPKLMSGEIDVSNIKLEL